MFFKARGLRPFHGEASGWAASVVVVVVLTGVWALSVGCYGKDNGPKHPRAQAQFNQIVAKFTARMKQCLPEAVQANMNRPMTETERANSKIVAQALSNFKTELTQCLTGEGYGNEVQLEAAKVKGWLAQPDCATFAKTVFNAAECSALQMVLEDSGFQAK